MNMTAHAVGVDCWEEHSPEYFNFREPVSKMRDVIDKDIPIIRVKTEIEVLFETAEACYNTGYYDCYFSYKPIRFALDEPLTYTNTSYQWAPYYHYDSYGVYYTNKSGYNIALQNSAGYVRGPKTGIVDTSDINSNNAYVYNPVSQDKSDYQYIFNHHYVHTYCIASDHSSSGGGGGGAAGASVNYIIKAN